MDVIRSKCVLALLFGYLLLTAGCATKYQAYNQWSMHGYKELGAETNFFIEFIGNNYTPSERMSLFLRYRCAELTLEKGYTHFYHLPMTPQDHFIDYIGPWTRIELSNGVKPDSIDVVLIDAVELLKELKPKMAPYMKNK